MNNQPISLDGSSVVYATEFIRVSETGTSSIKQDFATITYVDNEISNINVGAGGGINKSGRFRYTISTNNSTKHRTGFSDYRY